MKNINIDWTDGKSVAKAFNSLPHNNSLKVDEFMKTFWICWGNESDEWQTDFIMSADSNVIVWVINHSK